MSGMDKIIAIHGVPLSDFSVLGCRPESLGFLFTVEDSDLVCQPGVGWMEINETLKEKGIPLFFPVCAES
jgi:FAD/FMN-containing dehydrogenase